MERVQAFREIGSSGSGDVRLRTFRAGGEPLWIWPWTFACLASKSRPAAAAAYPGQDYAGAAQLV